MNEWPITVGIFVFPEVEVLDFAGPYEVFTTASRVDARDKTAGARHFKVLAVARELEPGRARAGLIVMPDCSFATHPAIEMLVILGGVVDAQLRTPAVEEWIKRMSETAQITASVCNGALLLAKAGLLARSCEKML